MATERTKHLSYIEDTPKHHDMIEALAIKSSTIAIAESHAASVPVTYLEGESIVKVDSDGSKEVIGTINNEPREAEVGAKFTIDLK